MMHKHETKQTSSITSLASIVCRNLQHRFGPYLLENGLPAPCFQRWNA